MADEMQNSTQPKLRPKKLSAQRVTAAGTQNSKLDESLSHGQLNVQNMTAERKKHNKRNKKKKAAVVSAPVGASVNVEAAILLEGAQSRSADHVAPPAAKVHNQRNGKKKGSIVTAPVGALVNAEAAVLLEGAQSRSADHVAPPAATVHNKRNRKKKGPIVTASVGASVNVEAGILQAGAQSRSANDDAPPPTAAAVLNPQEKLVLEQNYISILDKKCDRNPKAAFLCKLCKYYCNDMTFVVKHISHKRHLKAVEEETERVTLLNLPPPTPEQLKYLEEFLKEEVRLHGLTDSDILARQNITAILSKSVAEMMPGFTVRLYGSSASGFGLKKSDVNLELCVPPEKSLSKGLADAYDVIASKATYSKVERDFTAKIPAVRFIDNATNLPCILMLCNNHSYKIAELLSKYASISERVRTLGLAFRLWAQRCRLDSAEAGMWPSYAFPLLLVYFLQQLKDPVLPVLHELIDVTDVENASDVYLDPKNLEEKWQSENTMCLGELWLEMFRFYALDFDILERVVCIQQSSPDLRIGSMKKGIGRRIAIRDPFMPKRNATRSMSTLASCEYCMTCFQNTYKYFGILRTKTGPIFDIIFLDAQKEFSSPCKEIATADKLTKNMNGNHLSYSKDDSSVTVPKVEEELQKTSLKNHKNGVNFVSVSVQEAQKLFSSFNGTYLHYEFHGENFIGNQKYPEICTLCQKDGHSKDSCKEEQLFDFDTTLPPMEEFCKEALDSLCAQMLAKWAITPEEVEIRMKIASDIEECILQYYPTAKLELFGSTCNGFGLRKSDIDICLTFTGSETGKEHDFVKVIEDLQDKLKKCRLLNKLVPVTSAKVPILKFNHMQSKLEGDISIYNTLGQQNTKLLRTYSKIDRRVKMLGYMIKRFAKVCDMCDASRGSLSSYAYIIMVIYFLQQCSPPVLPVLQELSETEPKPQRLVEDCDTYFYEDLDNLEKLWPDYGKNTSSVGELWIQFLRFYSAEFDFATYAISIRQRARLLRFEKLWTSKCMAIEDPFDLSHNLGVGLSRNMHVYIIKSFRKGYIHFGTSPTDVALMMKNPENYYFMPEKLTSGKPPNDRGCHICNKIGHISKDCPQKKQGRQKRNGQRGGAGGRRNYSNLSTVNGVDMVRHYHAMNNSFRGHNVPFGLLHTPMHGAQSGRERLHNPRELPPYRGGYNPVHGNFRAHDTSVVRYGMPHTSPPFKSSASPLVMSTRIGASGLPPFGRVEGSMGPERGNYHMNQIGKHPVDTHADLRPGQRLQVCYEMAHRLGLIHNRNPNKDLNQLMPKGEIHRMPQAPGNIVVMDVFPHSQR